MYTQTIHEQIAINKKLIKAIESVHGWFIEWNADSIRLSADTEERLNDLIEFFNMFNNK